MKAPLVVSLSGEKGGIGRFTSKEAIVKRRGLTLHPGIMGWPILPRDCQTSVDSDANGASSDELLVNPLEA